MTTLNKPENTKTNEAHDLGQISIKTLRALVEWIGNRQEKIADDMLFTNAPHDPQYHYLDGQYNALHDALMFMLNFKATEPEIREGMAEFIGPLRPIWSWTKNHAGRDPRAMTTSENANYYNAFRSDYPYAKFSEQPIDAPRYIAAGSTEASSHNDDRDRNIFPKTIDREWMHL